MPLPTSKRLSDRDSNFSARQTSRPITNYTAAELMAAYDQLPRNVREAIGELVMPFETVSVLSAVRLYGASFIAEDLRRVDFAQVAADSKTLWGRPVDPIVQIRRTPVARRRGSNPAYRVDLGGAGRLARGRL